MGAFGELLQKHFGETRHDVKTWGSSDKEESNTSNNYCTTCKKDVTSYLKPHTGWFCKECETFIPIKKA